MVRQISTESVKDIIKVLSDEQKLDVLEFLKREVSVYEIDGRRVVSEYALPVSVFKHGLSGLETVCVFLKDVEGLRFSEIGKVLNRSPVTTRLSYRNGRKKYKGKLDVSEKDVRVPVEMFKNRKRSVLTHVVAYLKDVEKMSYKEIAKLMKRDYKTVWTAYKR